MKVTIAVQVNADAYWTTDHLAEDEVSVEAPGTTLERLAWPEFVAGLVEDAVRRACVAEAAKEETERLEEQSEQA